MSFIYLGAYYTGLCILYLFKVLIFVSDLYLKDYFLQTMLPNLGIWTPTRCCNINLCLVFFVFQTFLESLLFSFSCLVNDWISSFSRRKQSLVKLVRIIRHMWRGVSSRQCFVVWWSQSLVQVIPCLANCIIV